IVEPAAAELAAARATPEEIESLLGWYRQIEVNTRNDKARLEADANFHATIFAACHNVFLSQMNTTVGMALRATQQISVHLSDVMEESVRAHKDVATAIARRDGKSARAAMERLVKQATGYIHRALHSEAR
ncbi:MAG TPA: FCD domain-containing protein, partial [Planctomycetaceae bacterium]|nr:FCD domain-containing protein [Planctomycetaceae bacterium]